MQTTNGTAGLPLPRGKAFAGMAGAYSALYTPFKKDGSLNEEMIEKVIDYGLSRGLRGFYLTGSTGEGFLLSKDERKRVYARAAKAAKGRAKLIAHVGCLATDDAVELAKFAAKTGIDWVSSVAPVYFGQCFDAAYDHYRRISSATDLPFMIYSLGADIVPDRDAKFFDLKNVKGMKYTNYKYWTVQALRNRLSKEVIFFAGICELAGANDFVAAAKLQDEVVRFVEQLIAKPNGSWHKSMMKYIGLDCGEGRAPNGRHLSKDELKDLFARLDALGFVRRNDARK